MRNPIARFDVFKYLILAALAFAAVHAQSQDASSDTYKIDFQPWSGRKISFRTADGEWIGYSASDMTLEMLIDGNTYRQSATPNGIDVSRLLSQLSPMKGSDGNTYFSMTLQAETKTEGGKVLPAGTSVLLNSNDFYVTRELQPSTSSSASDVPTPPQKRAVSDWNNDLQQNGVTAPTRPSDVDPDNAADAKDDTPTNDTSTENEDDESTDPASELTPPSISGVQICGDRFPDQFLSSPVCNCDPQVAGRPGACGVSSNFGFRVASRTQDGGHSSSHHKGMDISSGHAGQLTTIVAAADGCLKISRPRNGQQVDRPQNGQIPLSAFYEHGFGYTVRLMHGNGWETQYSHLSSISAAVRHGGCFKRGQRIGTMGRSGGKTTGYNLHFGVAHDRQYVNPRFVLMGTSSGFLSQTCDERRAKYPELDAEMKQDLAGGVKCQANLSGYRAAPARRASAAH